MPEFRASLKPYDLQNALKVDHGDNCLVIDVGGGDGGQAVSSVKRVSDLVDHYLYERPERVLLATKLYVIGDWRSSTGSERKDSITAVSC